MTVMPCVAILRVHSVFSIKFLLLYIPVAIPSKIHQSVFIEQFLLLDHMLKVALFLLDRLPLEPPGSGLTCNVVAFFALSKSL